ncbi:hypothetical protein SLG_15370 [Sphingobium sp. SYK-6]|nr:hypothetical protein SLG_15370 [Sphingobium sp. SYK-6]
MRSGPPGITPDGRPPYSPGPSATGDCQHPVWQPRFKRHRRCTRPPPGSRIRTGESDLNHKGAGAYRTSRSAPTVKRKAFPAIGF